MDRKLLEGWEWKKMKEICEINPAISKPANLSSETCISFVPMASIDDWSGKIISEEVRPIVKIWNGYKRFAEGDILFARITPCMENGKAAIATKLLNGLGTGSTEFHILRPGKRVLAKWIHYFIRQDSFLKEAAKGMTGTAGQQRLPKYYLENAMIPVPPIEIQRRIVAILDKAEETKRLRAKADEQAGHLLNSVFLELFGDPLRNPKNWERKPLKNFISFMTSGSRGWAKFYSKSGSRFIRVQNLTGHRLNLENAAFVSPLDTAETKRTKIEPGDLLISITGIVGLVAVAPFDIDDAYVSQHVAILRLNKSIDPYFVAAFLSNPTGGQVQLLKQQYGQTKPGLGLKDIESVQIFVPPLELQKAFTTILEENNALSNKMKSGGKECNNLADTLLEKAFNGELIA